MIGSFLDFLVCEAFQVRVNSHGERTKHKKCPPGYKLSSDGTHCVKLTSTEHMHRARGRRRANTKLRSQRSAIKRKRNLAMHKRHSLGL
uniref:Prohead core protein n=1 Tax=Pseudomonas phage Cygsa01 TaxID=3138529 RepID=A0AAU6W464_9VIRU